MPIVERVFLAGLPRGEETDRAASCHRPRFGSQHGAYPEPAPRDIASRHCHGPVETHELVRACTAGPVSFARFEDELGTRDAVQAEIPSAPGRVDAEHGRHDRHPPASRVGVSVGALTATCSCTAAVGVGQDPGPKRHRESSAGAPRYPRLRGHCSSLAFDQRSFRAILPTTRTQRTTPSSGARTNSTGLPRELPEVTTARSGA